METVYADGIANVVVGNGVVRIDLVTQRYEVPAEGASKEARVAKLDHTHQLVMPLPGLLQSLALLEQVRAQLVKDGAVQVKPRDAKPAAPAGD